MNEFAIKNVGAFFDSISAWRVAYRRARLHFLAVHQERQLALVSARIYLDAGTSDDNVKPPFRAGVVEAGQWEIPQSTLSVEQLVSALVGENGFDVPGLGTLRLLSTAQNEVFVAPPTLLHPEGLNTGNRLAVLGIGGLNCNEWIPQPETDWLLKAADSPYDSLHELRIDFGLGAARGDRSLLEVVARTTVEVLAGSQVDGAAARLGIWMASTLDRDKAKIGYRVLDKGQVIKRGSISGSALAWRDEGVASVGIAELEVPPGAIVQCIASFDGQAHHVQWRADPKIFQNPRAAVLSLVDQNQQVIRGYLKPELPLRGRAADDFEDAVGWMLWALGFAGASFGLNAKTRDAFDMVAVAPKGDFVVLECTLGLLRADGKLARLTARAATLRASLDASPMTHVRVLPVIVTAMTAEQVRADSVQAEELGVLVLTRENLDRAFDELIRFPDADRLYEEAISRVAERKAARSMAASNL